MKTFFLLQSLQATIRTCDKLEQWSQVFPDGLKAHSVRVAVTDLLQKLVDQLQRTLVHPYPFHHLRSKMDEQLVRKTSVF